MVIAIDKVYETVAIVPRPTYQQLSVYSQLEFSDHRRHKEQVNFRSVLHPVRYSDTAFVYINNTRKRFVSRTFYELRVRPQSFSETTYNNPKSGELHYVTHLDYHADENKKWFKTCVEIKAKTFTSAQLLRSQNNNYISTSSTDLLSSSDLSSSYFPNGSLSDNDDSLNSDSQNGIPGAGRFQEKYDPGASQVFIPQRKDRPLGHNSLVNGEITLKFSNSKTNLPLNGDIDNFSDV
jgi:hypothetical protein